MKKCLIVFNDENYVIFLHGNKLVHLFDEIKKKKDLYNQLSFDSKLHQFFIFDKDFETYVHLDNDIEIENLSKILIRSKTTDNNFLNLNYKLSNNNLKEDDTNESIVVSVNPNDLNGQSMLSNDQLCVQSNSQLNEHLNSNQLNNRLNNQTNNHLNNHLNHNLNNQLNNQLNKQLNNQLNNHLNDTQTKCSNLIQTQEKVEENATASFNNNLDENSELITNEFSGDELSIDLNLDDKRLNDNPNIEVEWPEDDITILLQCCRQYIQEFAYYNINVDLIYIKNQDDESLWEQISKMVKKNTSKSYNKVQCKSKFIQLRTTYININAYSSIENTYFGQLKYFKLLKELIDGLQPSIDFLQLNNQLKTRKESIRYKERVKEKSNSSYLALIQQVKAYSFKFSENAVSKTTVWTEIANNLNNQGYKFNGKSCQNLFHRLRYTYLHLMKTITNESEGKKWPYFVHFSGIDLLPFTTKSRDGKRKTRKIKNDDEGEEELEDESNDFDNFGEQNFEDNLEQNDENYTYDNKRLKSS